MATIITKNSSTASSVPLNTQLVQGELAVNVTDKRLFTENASGTVVELGTNPSSLTLPNGTANGVAYLNGSKVLTSGSALVFDGSNLGIGVTPSAWGSSYKAIQLGGTVPYITSNNQYLGVGANYYRDGSANHVYVTSSVAATNYTQEAGVHKWWNAPSGTAGNAISFTQAMTLDASGNLLVGTTSQYGSQKLSLNGGIAIDGRSASTPGLSEKSDDDTGIFWPTANTLGFTTGGSERARIDSSGNLLVGTTSSDGVFTGTAVNTGTAIERTGSIGKQRNDDACAYWSKASGFTAGAFHSFWVNGSQVGSISTSGSSTAYNTSSDYRLKEDIQPMTGALAKVAALKPCTYKWKADGSDGEGFIAHELQSVVPQCVTGEKDAVDAEGKPVYQGIDTSFLVATLTAAIQELKAEFDAYKAAHP